MSDEYPREEELKTITEWPSDWPALMAYVKHLWWAADWGWTQKEERYNISTGGWSGNESLISAMAQNFVFWAACWENHRRGGHYTFIVK